MIADPSSIVFSPALGEHTAVPLPALPAPGQHLLFRAAFPNPAARAALLRAGARLELWSDLPAAGRTGDWGPIPFDVPAAAREHTLSVAGAAHDDDDSAHDDSDSVEQRSLYLSVPAHVLLAGQQTRFAFTYRLVYADGGVRWLGAFGHDGVLSVARDARFTLAPGWTRADDGTDLCWADTHTGAGEREVARLSADLDWTAWAKAEDASWAACPALASPPTTDVVLVPRPRAHAVLPPLPLVLSTAAPASLRVSPTGALLHTPAPHAPLRMRTLLRAPGPALSHGIAGAHGTAGSHAVLAHPTPHGALALTVLPLVPAPFQQDVHIPLAALAALLPSTPPAPVLSAYCADAQAAVFLPPSAAALTLRVGPHGGHAVIAHAHALPHGAHAVALLSPHAHAKVEREREPSARLPLTPPPSPPLTRAHPLPAAPGPEADADVDWDAQDPDVEPLPAAPAADANAVVPAQPNAVRARAHSAAQLRVFLAMFALLLRLLYQRLVGSLLAAQSDASPGPEPGSVPAPAPESGPLSEPEPEPAPALTVSDLAEAEADDDDDSDSETVVPDDAAPVLLADVRGAAVALLVRGEPAGLRFALDGQAVKPSVRRVGTCGAGMGHAGSGSGSGKGADDGAVYVVEFGAREGARLVVSLA